MKKPLVAAAAAFLVCAGLLLWWFSDSQVLKRNTQALAEHLTISANDAKSTRAAKSQDFVALLAADFGGTLKTNTYTGDITRDEAASGHQYFAQSCESSSVTVTDISINSISGTSATIEATYGASIVMKGGRSYSENAQATMIWKKADGGVWKLQSITVQ